MTSLELLAPARNLSVGIAAIDCGADAVYIAGPAFGARKDAGNCVEDIASLCRYAHRYGVRIYVAVNTLVYEEELPQVRELLLGLKEAGADALIVQDLSLLTLAQDLDLPLHASTQCAIRTPERASELQAAGFSRLILERQLSLAEIRAIRRAAPEVELEFFVHGALCVCYSGQCYLSEALCGRSANRGACVQACRSRYDVYDSSGKVLAKNKAVLSLKDLQLIDRMEDLAREGICSFKIEGRLKNESYVRNVVSAYSRALNALIEAHPDRWRRASFGRVTSRLDDGLTDTSVLRKTFNRDYTGLYLDGKKGRWAAMDAPKGMGEPVGFVGRAGRGFIEIDAPASVLPFCPGDGLSFVLPDGEIKGFRADTVQGIRIGCTVPEGLRAGMPLFRNLDAAFEKALSSANFRRQIAVELTLECTPLSDKRWNLSAAAVSEDGRRAQWSRDLEAPIAENAERMRALMQAQLSKATGIYSCSLRCPTGNPQPLLPASFLNGIRRSLCEELDAQTCLMRPIYRSNRNGTIALSTVSYKDNLSNSLAASRIEHPAPAPGAPLTAFELFHQKDAELMRTRYCLRYEWGFCPRQQNTADKKGTAGPAPSTAPAPGPFFLENNGRRFRLDFDCTHCEMTLSEA